MGAEAVPRSPNWKTNLFGIGGGGPLFLPVKEERWHACRIPNSVSKIRESERQKNAPKRSEGFGSLKQLPSGGAKHKAMTSGINQALKGEERPGF